MENLTWHNLMTKRAILILLDTIILIFLSQRSFLCEKRRCKNNSEKQLVFELLPFEIWKY